MYALLVTDVLTTRFDYKLFGPYPTREACENLVIPMAKNRTRQVLRLLDAGASDDLAGLYAQNEEG